MKRKLFAMMLFTVILAGAVSAQQGGWVSRYWDGCKPSCSWSGKQYANNVGRCKECDRSNNIMATNDANRSSCDGGNSYTCWDMIPFVDASDPNKAYAFAATPSDQCGQCFELTFNGQGQHGSGPSHAALVGKTLVVMGSNMGGDVGAGQFDLLVPGGGVGQFDSFSSQIGVSALGQRYGGLLADCANNNTAAVATNQSCLREKCNTAFGKAGLEWLKAGCNFYADWLMAANNPKMTYRTVTCPQVLVDRYQKAVPGGPPTGPVTPPPGGNYTLTVNRNPQAGGTTNPAASQANIAAGTAVSISATAASGYTFANWTAGAGAAIANPNSASTTVTLTANATVTANFSQGGTPPPTSGGTITVQAESLTAPNISQCPQNPPSSQTMCIGTNNGITNIGYIQANNTATYNVNVPRAGAYAVRFRVAMNQADVQSGSGISITVNGAQAGTVAISGTGGWDTYQTLPLGSNVQLNQGNNTIVLTFQNAVNVDYFELVEVAVSVRHSVAAAVRGSVVLKAGAGGFTAMLPANHGYTSYRLVNLQGREIRSGKIGDGAVDLRFDNVSNSVFFLRLTGKNGAATVLRAVTY